MKPKTGYTGNLLPIKNRKHSQQKNDNKYQTHDQRSNSRLVNLSVAIFFILIFLASLLNALSLFGKDKTTSITPDTLKLKALNIGDTVPDIVLSNIHNYPKSSLKLSELRGKLVILDFWATWCAPCVAMIPKMDSLQETFGNKIQFLSVTYQSDKEVLPFLEKLEQRRQTKSKLPVLTNSKTLQVLFPHTTLPHYVWIGPDGVVKAITGLEAISAANIGQLLQGRASLKEKKDISVPYSSTLPLLSQQGGPFTSQLLYQSTLTRYLEGIEAGASVIAADSLRGPKIVLRNVPLTWLYSMAWSNKGYFGDNRILMEVQDSSKLTSRESGEPFLDWLRAGNGYSYELIVPPHLATRSFELMQTDLDRLFPQYRGLVDTRNTKVLVLRRTSGKDKLKTSGGSQEVEVDAMHCRLRNAYLKSLTQRLSAMYLQGKPPLIDDTGYKEKVDLDINAALYDLEALNKDLKRYDLEITEQQRMIDMLVISDR